MTLLQEFMLSRGHPRQIILHAVGGIWAIYFLWMHNWLWALGCFGVAELTSEMLATGTGVELLAETTLGKIMLLHAHPVNFVMQIAGGILLVYSMWLHSITGIMVATSVFLLGHFAGWSRVNAAL